MSKRKINLEEIKQLIFDKHQVQYDDYDMSVFDDCILEFGKQLLELAAENAEARGSSCGFGSYWVDKQSILDTIKQVE